MHLHIFIKLIKLSMDIFLMGVCEYVFIWVYSQNYASIILVIHD